MTDALPCIWYKSKVNKRQVRGFMSMDMDWGSVSDTGGLKRSVKAVTSPNRPPAGSNVERQKANTCNSKDGRGPVGLHPAGRVQ